MKKTLMTVLCFALGTSFATAQTNIVERVKAKQQQQMAVSVNNTVQNTSYKGSIFTKAAGDTIFSTSFSAADLAAGKFTTGVVDVAYQIGSGTDAITAEVHAQVKNHAKWNRINDTSEATYNSVASTYQSGQIENFSDYVTSTTPGDGFMLMTMHDQISSWGGSGDPGAFDSYIQFQNFATDDRPVDVRLWQFYRKFNADKCYLDYSTDGGSTWAGTVEFNVRGVDVATNSNIRGRVLVTMPAACLNQASLTLRLRWTSTSNSGGAYGYYWFVDDVDITKGPDSRMNVVDYANYDGFYQIMPQGLEVPLVSYVTFANTGKNPQTNVTSKIFTYAEGETGVVTAESDAIASVAFDPADSKQVLIDPLGFFGGTGFDYSAACDTARTGTKGSLPTDFEEGTNMGFYFNQLHSAELALSLDTFGYEVSRPGDLASMPENMLWGRDNGVLRKYSAFTKGLTSDDYLSDDPNSNGVFQADYNVRMAYTTGDVVPEGWVIRGIQMVASTYPGYNNPQTQIYPILATDSAGTPDAEGSFSIYFNSVDHGAGVHTVSSSEIPTTDGLTFRTREGGYNVINIQFPNQPELKAKTSYRIGYQLVQPATFALATSAFYHYNEVPGVDTTAVLFDTTPGMEGYRNIQTLPYTKILVYDPMSTEGWAWVGNTAATSIPMIRMIVGPKVYIPNYALSVECGDEYTDILNGDFDNVCGMVDSLVEGSTNAFYAQANDPAYEIEKVYLDGEELENGDGILTLEVDDDGNTYAYIELADVRAHHTLSATTKRVSIDPVAAGVKMKLQPNPATNNVQLSISGVEGMVTYSLLDMSGRVISTARINAESISNIDLSKLAKGAYFVRITSDKFSKVEKLIVR